MQLEGRREAAARALRLIAVAARRILAVGTTRPVWRHAA
jgi:hypothetical protein